MADRPGEKRMLQGKPAGKFDDSTLEAIRTILAEHDDQMLRDAPALEPLPQNPRPTQRVNTAILTVEPIKDVQPRVKIAQFNAIDDQEEEQAHLLQVEQAAAAADPAEPDPEKPAACFRCSAAGARRKSRPRNPRPKARRSSPTTRGPTR